MTDTMQQGINVSPDALRAKYAEIAEIDEQLAAASGSTALGKRALSNSIVAQNEALWKELADAVVQRINEAGDDPEVRVALVNGVTETVKSAFGEAVDAYLEQQVKENAPAEGEKPSDTEMQTLMESARQKRKEYTALREILTMFGMDVSDIPEPKRLSGARGKRGPRALSKYNYIVDGTPRSKTQNSMSSIASTLCQPLKWNTKALRDFITENGYEVDEEGNFTGERGVDLANPPERFGVQLPDPVNKKVVAIRSESEDVFENSDDDDDDENENGENE